jgi:branched-chain amino acid transport system ATP-binding protein
VRECGSQGGILTTQEIAKHFGGLAALKDINLEIERGSITGIIGPNGSGKTTLFNVITGYLKATKGNVFYEEEKITGAKPYEIVNKGIARTFQVPQCCKLLTIRENIRLACLRTYSGETIEAKTREFAAVAKIDRHLEIEAKNVPIGFLRKTEIAMALATNPRLLLLDEPFSGLTDLECQEFSAIVKGLREKITLVVIDHKLKHLMPIVEKVHVLNEGRVFFTGSPEEVARNRDVQKIYIGGEIQ